MTLNDREEVKLQQEQLLDALLGLRQPPQEMDSEQVNACRLSLKHKRARVLMRLSGEDGSACDAVADIEMERYFRRYPGVHPNGGYADLRRYKLYLAIGRIKKLLGLSVT